MAFPVEAFIQAKKYHAEQRAPFSLAKSFGAGLGPGILKGIESGEAAKVAQSKFRSDATLAIFNKFKPMRANPDPNATDKWLEVDASEYPSILEQLQTSKGGELPGIKFLPITEPKELTPQKTYMVDKVSGKVTETDQPLFMGNAPKYLYSGEPAGMASGQTDADIITKIETLASNNSTDVAKQTALVNSVYSQLGVKQTSKPELIKRADTAAVKANELNTDIERTKAYQSYKRVPADASTLLERMRQNYKFLKAEGVTFPSFVEGMKAAESFLSGKQAFTKPLAAPAAPAAPSAPRQSLEQKAAAFLLQNNQVDTPENRKWAIDNGYVK